MKVTKELKELLRHKLSKVLEKKKQEKRDAIIKEHQEVISEITTLYKTRKDVDKEIRIKRQQFEVPSCSLNNDGTIDIYGDGVDFDVEDQLFNFIEKLELSDDSEGDLKGILESISKL